MGSTKKREIERLLKHLNISYQKREFRHLNYNVLLIRLLVIIIIGFNSIDSFSQSVYTPNSYWDIYSIRNIGLDEGLPSEAVFYTHEDSLGFIWVVSSGGLIRYDGLSVKQYTSGFVGGFLYEAHRDDSGNLWIPSVNKGIQKFDGERFTSYKSELESDNGLAKTMLINNDGNFFIGMYGTGLIEFDGEKVVAKYTEEDGLVGNTIWKVILDRKGNIWIGTDNGLSIFKDGKFSNFTTENGLPYNKIRGLTEMINGDIWVGTDGGGIVVFRDERPKEYFDTQSGLSGNFPQYFAQNPIDSTIWIAHHGQGLDVFRNSVFENLTEEDGLPSNFLTYIGFSNEGVGYVGSEMGLSILIEKIFKVIDKSIPGIESDRSISVIEEDNQTVWIGMEGSGFRYLFNDEWRQLENPPNLTNGYANGATKDPKGGIWFSTQGSGIVKIKNNRIVAHITEKNGLLNDFANGLTFDVDGLLWVGTNKGINVINEDLEIIKTYTTENGLPNNFCLSIGSSSDGSIWYGTYGGGLARIYEDEITLYDSTDGVFGASIYSIFEHSSGDLLISGDPGILSVFDGERFTYYDTDFGMPNTVFYGMEEDINGNIWASSQIGIFRIDLEEYEELRNKEASKVKYTHYTSEDGVPTQSLKVGVNAIISRIYSDEILFTSSQGTVVLNPEEAVINTESFLPYINEFIVDDNSLSLGSLRNLTPDDKKIEISYSALNIKSPKKTKFRIRLNGVDDQWVYVENRTTAYYDFLPDGNYSFNVSAIGPDGQWSDKTASIDFTVLPPFYKTWWFMTLGFFGFIGIGAGGVQIRSNMKLRRLNRELETQQKIQAERERISRELHDNVGSQITNLITGIEVSNLHLKKNQQDKALSLLDNLDSDARSAMTDLRETIWLLDKEKVEFGVFINHLRGYLKRQERYLEGLKVSLDSSVSNESVLDPGQSLNLTRIIQEALNNTRKYAEAATFSILCNQERNKIEIRINDDGKGMDVDIEIGKGSGLNNMAHRAKEMNGLFEINSEKGNGTEIRLSFEVKIP
jgi:signal transduction histidine kinase/sugar lactone lactonase YvrE